MKNSALHQHHKSYTEKAILKTLLYSDIFDFPLSKEEIWRLLISKKNITKTTFEHALQMLIHSSQVVHLDAFYCLAGKEKTITERKENLSEVANKYLLSQKVASYLSYIPTVLFLGISGGLAIGNGKKTDDIDFFIITRRNTLFVTRLWILALLEMMNLRRKRNERDTSNKICVNLLIEETALPWPARKRDIYTAHEIIQLKPLFERNDIYAKFLQANVWVKKFCPNAGASAPTLVGKNWKRNYVSIDAISVFLTASPVEMLVRKLQKISINKHRTKEVIADNFLAFHPVDYRAQTLHFLEKKSQYLGLLTKD